MDYLNTLFVSEVVTDISARKHTMFTSELCAAGMGSMMTLTQGPCDSLGESYMGVNLFSNFVFAPKCDCHLVAL
jgi:hypothetical protein